MILKSYEDKHLSLGQTLFVLYFNNVCILPSAPIFFENLHCTFFFRISFCIAVYGFDSVSLILYNYLCLVKNLSDNWVDLGPKF